MTNTPPQDIATLVYPHGAGQVCTVDPTIDDAPAGQEWFVYTRLRGEAPVCRLEMKYPKHREQFFLRLLLLHFPVVSFTDALRHEQSAT